MSNLYFDITFYYSDFTVLRTMEVKDGDVGKNLYPDGISMNVLDTIRFSLDSEYVRSIINSYWKFRTRSKKRMVVRRVSSTSGRGRGSND